MNSHQRFPETTSALPHESPDELKAEKTPFESHDWRASSYAWFGYGLRLLLIFGAIFSGYQYLQAREEKRIERTFELVDLWEQPEYQQAQRAFKARILDVSARTGDALGQNPTPQEVAFLQRRIGVEAITADGPRMPAAEMREQIDRIVYFLNRVAFCVEGNLCSRHVADAYFLDYARSFWSYFEGFAEQQRRDGAPTYAQSIERYAAGKR